MVVDAYSNPPQQTLHKKNCLTHLLPMIQSFFPTHCTITTITLLLPVLVLAAVTRPSVTILLTPMQLWIACTMQHCHVCFRYHPRSTAHQQILTHQTTSQPSYDPTATLTTLTIHYITHTCYKQIQYREDRNNFL